MPDQHSYAGLYYPFIHFKDDRWLKLSALYWDQMCRIVPSNYKTDDSDTVRDLGSFVQTLRPDWIQPDFGESFAEFVAENGTRLRELYGTHLRSLWGPVPQEQLPPAAGGRSGTDPRLGYVFYEKMSDNVLKVMLESGIALPDAGDPRWIGMHPLLARVYMTALADQLARERGLYPVTPEPLDQVATGGRTMQRVAQALLDDVDLVGAGGGQREVESIAAYTAFELVLPKNLDTVPVERILRFREKYPLERSRFQAWASAFSQSRQWIGEIRDPALQEKRLADEYRREVVPGIAELREKLHEVNIDTVLGAVAIQASVPSVAAGAATLAGVAINPVLAVGGGTAFAIARVLRDRRKAQQQVNSSPLAYLMRAEEYLRPSSLLQSILTNIRRFRFFRSAGRGTS